jgi:hypothetical protein
LYSIGPLTPVFWATPGALSSLAHNSMTAGLFDRQRFRNDTSYFADKAFSDFATQFFNPGFKRPANRIAQGLQGCGSATVMA